MPSGKIFDRIFEMLDTSKNGKVSKGEVLEYFYKLSQGPKK